MAGTDQITRVSLPISLLGTDAGPYITALPDPLNNDFGIQSGNLYNGMAMSQGTSGMSAATAIPLANFQINSRPNATAGLTNVDFGIFSYRHGTNTALDGNSWATSSFMVGIESDSTAIPVGALYHNLIAGSFIATAKAGSTAAAFGINPAAFLATTTGFANGAEIDIFNYSGASAVALTNGSAAYKQTKALALVSGISGAGSANNSAALTIEVQGGFSAAFLTGIRFGASSTKDYGIDMLNVGTGSSTAIPIRLGNSTIIKARNSADTLDLQLIGTFSGDNIIIGQSTFNSVSTPVAAWLHTAQTAQLKLGDTAAGSSPSFDIRSGGLAADYDSRITSVGGTATAGRGTMQLQASVVAVGSITTFSDGVRVVGLQDAITVPSTNPTGGGVLYSESGALKWRDPSGGIWVPIPNTAWTAWTPTWTNLTIGNGTQVAKYTQHGKLIVARLSLKFGSTSSISGDVSFTLPVTSVTYDGLATIQQLGGGSILDSGTAQFHAVAMWGSTTTALVRVLFVGTYVSNTLLSSTVPMTWAVNDEINLQFSFEAA